MRKLQRGVAPTCLANYRHGLNNWADVTFDEKILIWDALELMQGQRCAYCEGGFIYSKRHIEHFRQKGRDPKETFNWGNLFGSCNKITSCGKYKDSLPPYDPANLIKPDQEDPEHFFVFASNGSIAIREGLNTLDRYRASETIRIFNLNGSLRQMRFSALASYVEMGDEAQRMVERGECSIEDCGKLFESELSATANLPFSTAIKHTLIRL